MIVIKAEAHTAKPDKNIVATASLRFQGRCSFQISIKGQMRISSSMMKCGIPAPKRDIMGVSGHLPGTVASQNLRIGVHCMQMSVT